MFISKKDLNDLKSKAGAASQLQSQIDKLKNELRELSAELGIEDKNTSLIERYAFYIWGYNTSVSRRLKDVIKSIESRLDRQEKMQKMLFAHLGIEYAKVTDHTTERTIEKEVLRKKRKDSRSRN
jgi:hypothetical protein